MKAPLVRGSAQSYTNEQKLQDKMLALTNGWFHASILLALNIIN